MNKKLLVVVDMQRDFLEGALGTREAQALLPRVRERIEGAKAAGETVVFTRDTHDYDYLQTQEGKKLPVPHCIRGTEGWEIDPFCPPRAAACSTSRPSAAALWRRTPPKRGLQPWN